jgi:hypothetical protein
LGYIEEARQALKSLRDEHAKERQERLKEEQRLRMQQMQVKLEQIRHKKYVSYSVNPLYNINSFRRAC